MSPRQLVFAMMADEGELEKETLILSRSIRAFAGNFCSNPIWILFPDEFSHLSQSLLKEYEQLEIQLIPFSIDRAVLKFPYAAKIYAASLAEDLAFNHFERLAWFDATSILIQQPDPLIIPNNISLGYRPVDHTLIGSLYHEPLDAFWNNIYQACGVSQEFLFPMPTMADLNIIRPYFNAGFLVIRPEAALLHKSMENFKMHYRKKIFQDFFYQDERYKIFFHQAILSGTILSSLAPEEMVMLKNTINYPLHMHFEIPQDRRINTMNDLTSGRYCMSYNPNWLGSIPVEEPLKSWLYNQPGLV